VVVTKISVFWDTTSCSPFKVNERFGVSRRFHLQGRKICQCESGNSGFLLIPPQRRLTFNGLHGVTSQEIQLFETLLVFFVMYTPSAVGSRVGIMLVT
jgi:hypothetical protein